MVNLSGDLEIHDFENNIRGHLTGRLQFEFREKQGLGWIQTSSIRLKDSTVQKYVFFHLVFSVSF